MKTVRIGHEALRRTECRCWLWVDRLGRRFRALMADDRGQGHGAEIVIGIAIATALGMLLLSLFSAGFRDIIGRMFDRLRSLFE